MALSARDIEFSPPGKLHDGDGLYLDKRSETSASWVYKYTWKGRPAEVGLGPLKKVSAEKARELRVWCEAELAADRNPKETRQGAKDAAREAAKPADPRLKLTVRLLARDELDRIATPDLTAGVQQTWVHQMSKMIGKLSEMRPADITRDDVIEVFQPLYDRTPVQAEVCRMRLAMVLRHARATDLILNTPDWVNPAEWRGNLKSWIKVKKRKPVNHAALLPDQVPAFIAELRKPKLRLSITALALEWVILSAVRANEGASARWEEIDLASDCYVIPAERMKVKTNGDHRVPLTPRHHEILALARELTASNGTEGAIFVSPQERRAEQSVTARKLWDVVQKTPAAAACTVHGFRASFATWAEEQVIEVPVENGEVELVARYKEEVIEFCLAHVVGTEASRAYRRKDALEMRRRVITAWGRHCASACEPASEVRKLAA